MSGERHCGRRASLCVTIFVGDAEACVRPKSLSRAVVVWSVVAMTGKRSPKKLAELHRRMEDNPRFQSQNDTSRKMRKSYSELGVQRDALHSEQQELHARQQALHNEQQAQARARQEFEEQQRRAVGRLLTRRQLLASQADHIEREQQQIDQQLQRMDALPEGLRRHREQAQAMAKGSREMLSVVASLKPDLWMHRVADAESLLSAVRTRLPHHMLAHMLGNRLMGAADVMGTNTQLDNTLFEMTNLKKELEKLVPAVKHAVMAMQSTSMVMQAGANAMANSEDVAEAEARAVEMRKGWALGMQG